MPNKDDQFNFRTVNKLGSDLRKSVKARAKAEGSRFNITDFFVEAAKAHIKKWLP